ncbi:MAG: CDP-alcohol phosphatidyltransferase family protein [Ruminococcaceae bacterium]|nr:CDP-alcohol phosphatidyltransferase family protein [Oscillospiraceae bacterium]
MFIKDWKKDVLTIPNMLSLFRLVLIPVYIVIYLNATTTREYFLAGTILAVSCLTDMIDGQIARHFNMISNVGKVLDPIADKLTQLALTVCLSVKYPVLRMVLVLFVAKEAFQTLALVVMYRRGKVLPGSLMPGKLCTTVLFLSFIVMVLIPDLNIRLVNAIAILDAAFLVYAFIGYFLAYFGRNPKLQDFEKS